MSEAIHWSFNVQVSGGPRIAASDLLNVEAYDKIRVTIADGQTYRVDLAPGKAGAIELVVVKPATPSEKLTYEIGTDTFKLNAPLLLLGSGAVALLGANATSLSIKNQTGADAEVEILVGRDATP